MSASFSEVTKQLLAGQSVAWQKFGDHKAGTIRLEKPEQRRLLEFLLSADPDKVASGDESLFAGLVAAWENNEYDPASVAAATPTSSDHKSWRLTRVEASGFGGLTVFGGKPFDLYIGGHNWCLEGQNGSGKTSLVSAILWALTGYRIREHEGPVPEQGLREDVEGEDGKRIGTWPPLAAYPTKVADLQKSADVSVRLTFASGDNNTVTAFRRIVSPPQGAPISEEQIDPAIVDALRLAEIGILMPARITKIGFGKSSLTLYEAVKQLTGLDRLSDIADGCAALGAANRKFMKYAKDNRIDLHQNRFYENIDKAKQLSNEFDFTLPSPLRLEEGIDVPLKESARLASEAAGNHLETLKSEISPNVDINTSQGRSTVKTAVSNARGLVSQGTKAIPLFRIWKALTSALSDPNFSKLADAIPAARASLDQALGWHERQTADGKLRLKAIAAQSFFPVRTGDAECPLCESPLNDENKKELARELEELKANSDAAERKLGDACLNIQEATAGFLPAEVSASRDIIDQMNPSDSYSKAMHDAFTSDNSFASVLVGLTTSISTTISEQCKGLPVFSYPDFKASDGEPEAAIKLRRELHLLERLVALVRWWEASRPKFLEAWNTLIGRQLEDGSFPRGSVEGKLLELEQALNHARPLDDLSRNLTTAADAAGTWSNIQRVQETREAIRDSLEPVKNLRALVATETTSSITALSQTINSICERVVLRERLAYQETTITRKEVSVSGSFSPGIRIDAALVANTSWLRAILWSFILALREETLRALGRNPLPIVVLDDPQATFDPRNKRRWAQELVRGANLAESELFHSQLVVTTHERSFYQMLVDHEKFRAQQGLIGAVNKISGVATVANGGELRRIYDDAKANNDDARARDYIRKVRIYCEDLIKFMLRGISSQVPDLTLNQLKEELKRLRQDHVAPFDRRPFEALINALNESNKAIRYINDPHHKDDESFGVAEADAVKEYWDKTLLDKIHTAFGVFDTFERYTGEPRTFPWAKNVIEFPTGHKDRVKQCVMRQTGVAAAAKTDGRVGDGVITVTEWTTGEEVRLPNHGVFQLAAGTLDPVASIGDLIIVSNHAKVNARNLVAAASGNTLLARRLNRPENHAEIAVLTGQAVDPYSIPEPVIVPPDTRFRKIVGTLFTSHLLPLPPADSEKEFLEIPDLDILSRTLKDSRLFKVEGRSAEPVALDGQFLMTNKKPIKATEITTLDGRLVVAIDEDGARYFKRLRCHGTLVVLESLNPDGLTPAELLSLDGSHSLPRLMEALEVVGILFELPNN